MLQKADLNTRLLAAHADDDKPALVTLYTLAADQSDDRDTTCFFLTHAYIFALELHHPMRHQLYERLKAHDRV